MKKYGLILFLLLRINFAFSQCDKLPEINKLGKTWQSFIPQKWKLMDSATSDFNNDGLIDIALILENENNNEHDDDLNCHRPLLILEKTKNGFVLNTLCKQAVLCNQCGGVFGNPYNGITFKKNILTINHYGGSAWRWNINYIFRFQKTKKWELIGMYDNSYWTMGDCKENEIGGAALNSIDVNFNTSKAHIIKTKDDSCNPYEDVWKSFPKKTLEELKNFSVEKSYNPFPNED